MDSPLGHHNVLASLERVIPCAGAKLAEGVEGKDFMLPQFNVVHEVSILAQKLECRETQREIQGLLSESDMSGRVSLHSGHLLLKAFFLSRVWICSIVAAPTQTITTTHKTNPQDGIIQLYS